MKSSRDVPPTLRSRGSWRIGTERPPALDPPEHQSPDVCLQRGCAIALGVEHQATLHSKDSDSSRDRVLDTVLPIANKHKLSLYDAMYHELALRLRLPLATLDRKLVTMGKAAGVEILGL